MIKKKKILFGAVDIGYRIELYTKFIHSRYSNRMSAESFSKYVLPESHYKTQYTYTCEIYKKSKAYVYMYTFCFFIFALLEYDIFHFFSGETILTRKLRRIELATYKLFKKKVIMHFVGSDIRNNEYTKYKNNHLKEFLKGETENFPPLSEKWQIKLIQDAVRFADEIIVSTPDLLKIIPHATYFPVLIDIDKFNLEVPLNNDLTPKESITIIHCPSNKSVKGSEVIYEVLDKIKDKFGHKVNLILPGRSKDVAYYSLSRYSFMNEICNSHILIDQLTIGWYGLQSIEGLLTDNLVFCYLEHDLRVYQFPSTPIIHVDANTLYDKLCNAIEGYSFTSKNINRHAEWILKYHTIENNHSILLKAWGIN